MGFKLSALRLGDTCLILSRHGDHVSLGLISSQFMADAGRTYLVAPFVCFHLASATDLVPLTPYSDSLLELIARYSAPLFTTALDIKTHIANLP